MPQNRLIFRGGEKRSRENVGRWFDKSLRFGNFFGRCFYSFSHTFTIQRPLWVSRRNDEYLSLFTLLQQRRRGSGNVLGRQRLGFFLRGEIGINHVFRVTVFGKDLSARNANL